MVSTTDTAPTVPSATADVQATPVAVFSTPTTADLSMYDPVPSATVPTPVDSPIPEEILNLHTATNTRRLEFDSLLDDHSARLSDLDERFLQFTRSIQDLIDQRATLMDERDTLRMSHTELVSKRALLIASTA